MSKPHIVIISPPTAKANNGNGQTAIRWARFLRQRYRVTLASAADHAIGNIAPAAMIALHARRCAVPIAAYAAIFPQVPRIVVLTGTDLYRDIEFDAAARHSLALATRLVVLQDAGLSVLPRALHSKTSIIYQSALSLTPIVKNPGARIGEVIMIGHLRAEKDPLTFMHAAAKVTSPAVRMIHVGGALEPMLGEQALATQGRTPCYRWIGDQPRAQTRQRLKRAFLSVVTSIMEGGANVIIESVTSGVPVLASDISGNRGMLGDDYEGYFNVGDSQALASLVDRAVTDPAFHARLRAQCAARAPLFSPAREKAAVLELVDNCVHQSGRP
ncbi:MAG: TIGR04348 family glycosyltransferase [Herminiimonas sp.]|nr:TIGR04348 family glycosyltransferase [Herminiimonas sp.]